MNNEIRRFAAAISACVALFAVGCSARRLRSVDDIDRALGTSILRENKADDATVRGEKRLVRDVLVESKGEIIEGEREKKVLQAKVETERKFAKVGKWVVALVVGLFVLAVVVFAAKTYLRIQTGGLLK